MNRNLKLKFLQPNAVFRGSLLALALLCVVTFSPVVSSQVSNQIHLGSCAQSSVYPDAQCGSLEVFENRQTKTGRKISLNIAVLPALIRDHDPDPVFMLAGGPGQGVAAVYLPGVRKDQVAAIRAHRDIVLVDQRGTGGSHALPCVLYPAEAGVQAFFGDLFPADIVRACRDALSKDADLTQYTTSIAMDDLDEVRSALGYDKINLQGGSYGTRAVLVYMRQHPTHVRAVVLEGVAPTDYKLPIPIAKAVDHALDRLIEDCAADSVCHDAYPNLRADLNTVLASLAKEPAKVQAVNPLTKKPESITLPRRAFMDRLVSLLYSPDSSRLLPLLIHRAAQGDLSSFASIVATVVPQIEVSINRGMYLSVVCAEDLPWITPADITRETAGTLTGDERVKSGFAGCKDWLRANVSAEFVKPVQSSAPVLIISGDADPVAPSWIADGAAKFLPNSRHIIVRYGAHTTTSPCIDHLIENFIQAGSANSLDASCISAFRRPPFLVDASTAPQTPPAGANAVPAETWQGIIQSGATALHIVLKIFRSPDGKLFAVVDSPDQQAMGLKVDVVSSGNGRLHFEMNLLGAVYDGEISANGHDVHGTWTQGTTILPLDFHLSDVDHSKGNL